MYIPFQIQYLFCIHEIKPITRIYTNTWILSDCVIAVSIPCTDRTRNTVNENERTERKKIREKHTFRRNKEWKNSQRIISYAVCHYIISENTKKTVRGRVYVCEKKSKAIAASMMSKIPLRVVLMMTHNNSHSHTKQTAE